VRLVVESRPTTPAKYEAIRSIASKLGITSPESLRKWVRRAEVDDGARPGKTSDEIAEIKALKKEVAELRRANEILKSGGCRTDRLGVRRFGPTARATEPKHSRGGLQLRSG
jgi:transposase